MSYAKIICVDFDGVIHKYSKGWHTGQIYDEPVIGAINWLLKMSKKYYVKIYSSRSKDIHQHHGMVAWLDFYIKSLTQNAPYKFTENHGVCRDFPHYYDEESLRIETSKDAGITFPTQKPAAWLTIDDRAICFDGTFPTMDQIDSFKPWNRP